jgi:hypothetical protein
MRVVSSPFFSVKVAACSPASSRSPAIRASSCSDRSGPESRPCCDGPFPRRCSSTCSNVSVYTELLTHPERLEARALPHAPSRIVIDEVQRLPGLLNEVHRLIESRRWRFALTGSSARKLRTRRRASACCRSQRRSPGWPRCSGDARDGAAVTTPMRRRGKPAAGAVKRNLGQAQLFTLEVSP